MSDRDRAIPVVSIPLGEYKQLKENSLFLEILQNNGVDSWDGYEYSQDDFQQAMIDG